MAVINYSKKEISAKIVYYGPSLCGKTTNIQSIYASIKPDQKGKLVSLATEADRTLFFDFLPIEIANIRGFKTRLHFYTVPGQVYYNSTRRAVLTGVDGLVFVADSQRDKMEENIESLNNLEENLNYYGKSLKTIPLVIQYNKRDLPDVTPVSEMEQILNPYGYPSFEAVATTGEGVLETLTKVTKMVLQHIEMGTSGKQHRPAATPQAKTPGSADISPSFPQQPAPATRSPHGESPDARHPGPTPDLSLYDEPAPDRHLEAEPGQSLYGEMDPPVDPNARVTSGRIHIVGTDNAEIISANAISIPIRVKIEGDSKVYRMDLAVKLDGFKPEG
jgi:signal recognition particle receptor subunit beta